MSKRIKFYQTSEFGSPVWIPEHMIGPIEVYQYKDNSRTEVKSYTIYSAFDTTFVVRPAEVEELLGSTDAVLSMHIVRVERGNTKNSNSPMWRCYTADNAQINFFKHDDPDKNTFPLLDGYCDVFEEMENGDVLHWTDYPIEVDYQMNGDWREPVAVHPAVDGAEPDEDLDANTETLERIRGTVGELSESQPPNGDGIPF